MFHLFSMLVRATYSHGIVSKPEMLTSIASPSKTSRPCHAHIKYPAIPVALAVPVCRRSMIQRFLFNRSPFFAANNRNSASIHCKLAFSLIRPFTFSSVRHQQNEHTLLHGQIPLDESRPSFALRSIRQRVHDIRSVPQVSPMLRCSPLHLLHTNA